MQKLRRELTDEKYARVLDMITTATQRGESLTRQLLTFSRRQTLSPSVIDLAQRLPELKDMLSRSLRGDIEIDVAMPRESCAIKVDPNEFELALINLAVNARDAMPHGGSLTFGTESSGGVLSVWVTDTGAGIPIELHERMPDVEPRQRGLWELVGFVPERLQQLRAWNVLPRQQLWRRL